MALVFATAANALKFAGAAGKFEGAFHGYLLAGSGDFALEGSPVGVTVAVLVPQIALLGAIAILQIARAPVGDLPPVP